MTATARSADALVARPLRVGLGFSAALDPERAAEQAAATARAALGTDAAVAIAFVTTAHGGIPDPVERRLRAQTGAPMAAAAHVEGLLGDCGEWIARPAVAVLALAGARCDLEPLDGPAAGVHEIGEVLQDLPGGLGATDLVLVLADAHGVAMAQLARGLDGAAPAARLGLGVEGPAQQAAVQRIDGDRAPQGIALRVRAGAASCALAPGVRLRRARTVTRARGHWLLSIDGEPALDVFRAEAGTRFGGDLERARQHLHLARSAAAGGPPQAALARSIIGFDDARHAIASSEPLASGEALAFAVRDPLAARDSLSRAAGAVAAAAEGAAGLGLAVSCRSRGAALFGQEGLEAGYLADAFRGAAWLGLVGSYAISPLPGAAAVLGQAAALVRLGD